MNLNKIKDHFPEYSDMKLAEFYAYMHKKYYPDMKITDMYRALLKLTQIVRKEEVTEVEEVEKEKDVKPQEPEHKDTGIAELKDKIDILIQKVDNTAGQEKEAKVIQDSVVDYFRKAHEANNVIPEKAKDAPVEEKPIKEKPPLFDINSIPADLMVKRTSYLAGSGAKVKVKVNAKEAMKDIMDDIEKFTKVLADLEG